MFGQLMSSVLLRVQNPVTFFSIRTYKYIWKPGGGWSTMPIHRKTRDYFPRPNETKRVKKHGWNTRMSTLSGRKIIMNRILKGCAVLSN